MGRKEPSLHLIYGLLPLAVSFLGEQLRIASAQMVLDCRGFESAAEVGQLPESEEQQVVVVLTIVQRELGVMVLAAVVMVVLLARAATVTDAIGRRWDATTRWPSSMPLRLMASAHRAAVRRGQAAAGQPA